MHLACAKDGGIEVVATGIGKVNTQKVLRIDVEVVSECTQVIVLYHTVNDSLLSALVVSLDTSKINMCRLKMKRILKAVSSAGGNEAKLCISKQGALNDIKLIHRACNNNISTCITLYIGHKILEQSVEEQDIDTISINIET